MIYGHAASLLAALGTCAASPSCPRPALIKDNDDPSVRRCARHALEHLQSPAEAPSGC